MKNLMKKANKKVAMMLVAFAAMFTPSVVAAQAPSSYITDIGRGLFGEIQIIAPVLGLLVAAYGVLMYFIVGSNEHKKEKNKTVAVTAFICTVFIIIIQQVFNWFTNMV